MNLMKIQSVISIAICGALLTSCGSKEKAEREAAAAPTPADLVEKQSEVHGIEIKTIEITNPLKQEWVGKGKASYEMKCLPCHRLTEEKLVGPGWLGVTKRRQPVWVMNMITNVDMMLEQDEEAQKLLEQCLVRMPNQNVGEEEARHLLEFMRANDGEP